MFEISNEDINFIEKTMETWRVELTAGGRSLAEAKIQRGIFQGDTLSPLLFLIAMMPFNHILRKYTGGYKLNKSQEKNQSPNEHGRHQTLYKNKKEWETLIQAVTIYSQDIGIECDIEKCTMLIMKSEKLHMAEGMEPPNQEK